MIEYWTVATVLSLCIAALLLGMSVRMCRKLVKTRALYAAMKLQIEQGRTVLLPPSGIDPETMMVTLHMRDESVVVTRYGWDTTIQRRYIITGSRHAPCIIKSQLVGCSQPRSCDMAWYKAKLTMRRLNYLGVAVCKLYVSPGSHDDYVLAS